ncbi:hypothetical protein CAI21_03760 [Alkalilimnicola ehrlichii]|uniref:Molybdenum cofactor guanylyltransferase n=1 Tax=Alkalilimnicola ehrlichii TaxID=351052 RepID=A0A3E0X205_9GAMM|nr:molybdenum cofactor guanylyltransferase MobA [Alkalilimnicola ehrlichii]RFA30644.1 hypothetical protein CAI21_03760 [Alkalilimnicola ehrlichii]RFA38223.1 hypothetical protein CAL65_05120 [Alkalilimnicola ehrlichii]
MANASVTGLILAGGRATRMQGRDKGLVKLAGKPMIEHVIARLRPQTSALLINANRSQAAYAAYGFPVIADDLTGYEGPLAGIAAGLNVAETEWIATVPCDAPLLPKDLVDRLLSALRTRRAEVAVAKADGRWQPVFALIARRLLPSLDAYLAAGGRQVKRWYAECGAVEVDFEDSALGFANINSVDELTTLESVLRVAE